MRVEISADADGRRYCNKKIALSQTGEFKGEEFVVYDSKGKYGPKETGAGSMYEVTPLQTARYVRFWSSGADKTRWVHWIEADIFGHKWPMAHAHYVNLDQLKDANVICELAVRLRLQTRGCGCFSRSTADAECVLAVLQWALG